MPQLDFFIFQNIILTTIIIFIILTVFIYKNLIYIFTILKTRNLLNKKFKKKLILNPFYKNGEISGITKLSHKLKEIKNLKC